jgi:hypothetical protein
MTYVEAVLASLAVGLVLAATTLTIYYLHLRVRWHRRRASEMNAYRRRLEFRERTGMPGSLFPGRHAPVAEAVNRLTLAMQAFARTMRGETG